MLFPEPRGVDRDHDDAKHEAEHSTAHCGECSLTNGQSDENEANLEDWGMKLNAHGKPPKRNPPPAPTYHGR